MIDISEAQARVLEGVRPNGPWRRDLRSAVGMTLAEEIRYDIDSPPYDKALMDGYAVRVADLEPSGTTLDVTEQITAGQLPQHVVRSGTAAQIMTGAAVPDGADAVVMVEQTRGIPGGDGQRVRIEVDAVTSGQNILRQGMSARRGQPVLRTGHVIRARDVGVLCEAGRTAVRVVRPPRVAILATGDELVAPGVVPDPGQIRNTNGPMLAALVRQLHGDCTALGIRRDRQENIAAAVDRGLQHDVVLLSGGVSAGVLDLVPAVLERMGVTPVFHKVRLKPGKPMWFGRRTVRGRTTYVFGLPGNPVGVLVCFQLFVRPLLQTLRAAAPVHCRRVRAVLGKPHHQRGERPTYYPVRSVRRVGQARVVEPIPWHGSADQRAVAEADGLAIFPAGDHCYNERDEVDVLVMEGDHG